MTISTTAAKDLDINKIVLLAHRAASLVSAYQNVTESQRLAALDLLETIVNATATKGRFARVRDLRYVTLVTSTWAYDLPTDVIDVVGPGAYIDSSQTQTSPSSEQTVTRITLDDWKLQQGKNSTGSPVSFYVSRETDPAQVWVWPVPTSTENGGWIRFECHRLRATMTDGGATPDFERFWQQYFIWELGSQLAVQAGIDTERCAYLDSKAKQALQDCRGTSNQSNHQYLRFGHTTSWSGR